MAWEVKGEMSASGWLLAIGWKGEDTYGGEMCRTVAPSMAD